MKVFFSILIIISCSTLFFQIYTNNKKDQLINWDSEESISNFIEIRQDAENGEITYGPNFSNSSKALSENFSDIYLM